MSNPSIDENKRLLRRECRSRAIVNADRASAVIVDRLAGLLRDQPTWRCVAIYVALSGEPDLRALPILFPDRTFVYPRVQGADMSFHHVVDLATDLVTGPWGLSEPAPHLAITPLEEIDVMLCPGMAFTANGKRLGKGKGFYDRYLGQNGTRRPHLIGITFSEYLLDDIPCDEHDMRMDQVITD